MPDIYIDADACPVKNEVYRASGKFDMRVYVVANSYMKTPFEDRIRLKVVNTGFDAADNWIAEQVKENDIVITSDIPLADRCIKKGARVLDSRGREFTENSIGSKLAMRDLMDELRMSGKVTGGPPPFGKKDRSQFISRLYQVIQSILRPD